MKKGNETICALLDKVMRQQREIDNEKSRREELEKENEDLKHKVDFYKRKYSGKHCCLMLGCPFLMREDDE